MDTGSQRVSQLLKRILRNRRDVRAKKHFHPNECRSTSVGSYFTASEVPDFGNITRWEGRRQFLVHLLDVAGNHDGPEYKSLIELKYQRIKRDWAALACIKKTFNGSPECAWSESTFLAGQAAVCPNNLHAVSRFDHVHQVVVQDDVYRAGQLAGWGLLWHLLHGDGLVVLIDRETKLCLQGVVLFILLETWQQY